MWFSWQITLRKCFFFLSIFQLICISCDFIVVTSVQFTICILCRVENQCKYTIGDVVEMFDINAIDCLLWCCFFVNGVGNVPKIAPKRVFCLQFTCILHISVWPSFFIVLRPPLGAFCWSVVEIPCGGIANRIHVAFLWENAIQFFYLFRAVLKFEYLMWLIVLFDWKLMRLLSTSHNQLTIFSWEFGIKLGNWQWTWF